MKEDTALLVMDMQTAVLQRLPDSMAVVNSTAKAIAHARANNIPVIFIRLAYRQGAPEIHPNSPLKEWLSNVDMTEFVKLHPLLQPQNNELIVEKKRYSAFSGSDLEVILRAKGIKRLVLSGCSTSGIVLSTVREAADKDYDLLVLSDCCADSDEEVHRVLTTKVFPRQAKVLTTDEWSR